MRPSIPLLRTAMPEKAGGVVESGTCTDDDVLSIYAKVQKAGSPEPKAWLTRILVVARTSRRDALPASRSE